MFLAVIFVIVIVVVMVLVFKEEAKSQQHAAYQEERKQWQIEREEREKAYAAAMASALAELESKWGKCTKDIAVNYGREFYLSDRIYVFEESEKIALDGTVYDFKDIIGFSLLNKSKTVYNAYSTGKSKKDLGNMVARGIAGKMIGGDVGAVIGALSTPDEYEEDTEFDMDQENDYKIYVNVNNIASPTVRIDVGDFEDDAYEIANLLNVILARNKEKQ